MLALLSATQEYLLQVGGVVLVVLLADAWFTHKKAGGFVPSGQPLEGWWERRGWLVLCAVACLAALVPVLVAHIFRLEEAVERWRPFVWGILTRELLLTRDLGRIGLDLFGAEIVLLGIAARRPTWRMRVADARGGAGGAGRAGGVVCLRQHGMDAEAAGDADGRGAVRSWGWGRAGRRGEAFAGGRGGHLTGGGGGEGVIFLARAGIPAKEPDAFASDRRHRLRLAVHPAHHPPDPGAGVLFAPVPAG